MADEALKKRRIHREAVSAEIALPVAPETVPTQEHAMFLRPSQAARLLTMSRASIYAYIREGTIPSVRIAGQLRIPRAALLKFERDAMGEEKT